MQFWIKRRAVVTCLQAEIPKNARHQPASGHDRSEVRPHASAACGTEQSLACSAHGMVGRRILFRTRAMGHAGRADRTGQGREQNVSNQNARGRFRIKRPGKR